MDNEQNKPIDFQKGQSSATENDSFNSSPNDPYAAGPIFSNSLPAQDGPPKQSGLGIASFVLALLSVVLIIVAIVFATMFADQIVNSDLALTDPSDPAAIEQSLEELGGEALVPIMVAGLSIIAAIGVSFIGLILGIIGLFSKNRRKVFGIIGVILNGILVVGAILLIVIGLAISASGMA